MSEADRRRFSNRRAGWLPDWWSIRRLADAVSLKVATGAPSVVSISTAMAKPYLGLTEASLAGRDFRYAFIAFCACTLLWAGVVFTTFITLPRALRDHSSRLAAIEAFQKVAGASADPGVIATQRANIDHAAISHPSLRALILGLMGLAGVSGVVGFALLLRGLFPLPG